MQRVDVLLAEQNWVETRAQAQKLIAADKVTYRVGSDWVLVKKASLKLPPDTTFQIRTDAADRYVSRGALKLLAALKQTGLCPEGMVALDVGQSTGGFTDCLLQAGAGKVVGVDVGRDQLAEKLRRDDRVVFYEGINARDLPAETLMAHTGGHGFDLVVMDVSFISQTLILPGLSRLIRPGGHLISLVKPQFEVGRENVGKGGIVRDASLYPLLAEKITALCEELGLAVQTYMESPIKGGDGNREFLLSANKA